jgi:hypothetical protein
LLPEFLATFAEQLGGRTQSALFQGDDADRHIAKQLLEAQGLSIRCALAKI